MAADIHTGISSMVKYGEVDFRATRARTLEIQKHDNGLNAPMKVLSDDLWCWRRYAYSLFSNPYPISKEVVPLIICPRHTGAEWD
jgi:hypothetical protein